MSGQVVKGQRYKHPRLRGVYRVVSAGDKFVTLSSELPWLRNQRIPTEGFLRADWELISPPSTGVGEQE
jgi:hypothetical protein